jgi:predicted nuclease of predicted toxin-antitoxin system
MLPLSTDEDFNNRILRGLLRRMPDLDVTRVQDVGLSGSEDPDVLEWAAGEGRVLLTHDASTMSAFA